MIQVARAGTGIPHWSNELELATRMARSRWTRRRLFGMAAGAAAAVWAGRYGGARAAAESGGVIALPRARDIALVRPDGSEDRTLLTLQQGEFVADVALSPDGTRVAFGLFTARPGDGGGGSDIVVAPTEPGAARTVLVPRDRAGMLLAAPHWAPDGSALVFEGVGLSATGQASVTAEWVAADGSGRRVIATSGRYPSFSPDGKSVVYTKALPTGDSLMMQPLDGGEGREVVPDSAFLLITYPRFSPDGQSIAFTAVANAPATVPPGLPGPFGTPGPAGSPTVPNGPGVPKSILTGPGGGAGDARSVLAHGFPAEPFAVPVAGGDARRLAPLPIDDAAIAWSPDGASVAVSGANGLFVVNVADGSFRRVSENGSFGAIDWR
ncbi:MAG: hypothetical protein U0893_18785 [Chloroflexota bacterium]